MADSQHVEVLIERLLQRLGTGPTTFYDLLIDLEDVEYREILLAWGRIRERMTLERDEQGRYLLPGSKKVASQDDAAAPAVVDRM